MKNLELIYMKKKIFSANVDVKIIHIIIKFFISAILYLNSQLYLEVNLNTFSNIKSCLILYLIYKN